jgi:hypothetical protein
MARRKEALMSLPDAARDDMDRAFQQYLEEEEAVFGIKAGDLANEYPAMPPQFDRIADVAPLPPLVEFLNSKPRASSGCGGGCSGCGTGCSTKSELVPALNLID